MLVIYLCIYLFLHNACATKPSTLMIYALFTQEYIIYPIYFFTILNEGKLELTKGNLGKPTHTLVACWMPKPLPAGTNVQVGSPQLERVGELGYFVVGSFR